MLNPILRKPATVLRELIRPDNPDLALDDGNSLPNSNDRRSPLKDRQIPRTTALWAFLVLVLVNGGCDYEKPQT
jgi:hypothetical protein